MTIVRRAPRFWLGVDVGEQHDHTALAVLEKVHPPRPPWDAPWRGAGTPRPPAPPHEYHCRHLERLAAGMSYPRIVEVLQRRLQSDALRGTTRLVVNATGVGRAVVDTFRQAGLDPLPVLMTGGDRVLVDGPWRRVPKRDVISTVQVLLQAQRLAFVEGLRDTPTLIRELLDFRAKHTERAEATYDAWREGQHDDLVLAVAVAVWAAERPRSTRLPPSISFRTWR